MNDSVKKEIFLWMNSHIELIKKMSINDIAKMFYTLASTVTKSLQSYGYKGYKEFKQVAFINLLNNEVQRSSTSQWITNLIKKGIDDQEFANQMEYLKSKIKMANTIYIVGKGHSNLIGLYLNRQIVLLFNKKVTMVKDLFNTLSIKDNDLLISISLDLSTLFLNKIAKKVNCYKILITKRKPKYKKVDVKNYDYLLKIPNVLNNQENYDNPIVSKSIIEIAIALFLKNN